MSARFLVWDQVRAFAFIRDGLTLGYIDGEAGERFDAATQQVIDLLLTDPLSPWLTIPWLAPLPDPTYVFFDALIAQDPNRIGPVRDLPPL